MDLSVCAAVPAVHGGTVWYGTISAKQKDGGLGCWMLGLLRMLRMLRMPRVLVEIKHRQENRAT